NTTRLRLGAASGRDTRRAPSVRVEDRSLRPASAAPVLPGLCSLMQGRVPPFAIADRSICGETILLPHWTPPGCSSAPSAIPGQLIIASAGPHFDEASRPRSPLKATVLVGNSLLRYRPLSCF